MFANCQAGGMSTAFPDVCKTPAGPVVVPIPYPNMALLPMSVGFCPTILFGGAPAHNLTSIVPLTMGDDAGVLGGILSGIIMGPSTCMDGAFTVLLDGAPATRLTSSTLQNEINAPGICAVPSQTEVLLLAP
jgi:hypothetical protein